MFSLQASAIDDEDWINTSDCIGLMGGREISWTLDAVMERPSGLGLGSGLLVRFRADALPLALLVVDGKREKDGLLGCSDPDRSQRPGFANASPSCGLIWSSISVSRDDCPMILWLLLVNEGSLVSDFLGLTREVDELLGPLPSAWLNIMLYRSISAWGISIFMSEKSG